jgi:hypothetical protein
MYTGWFHPVTWVALILVFGGLMVLPMASIMYDVFHKGAVFQPSESISVVESTLHYSEQKDYPYISCIGTLRNHTEVAWEDLHFEARFFNSAGQLIDTLSDHDYSLVLRPHSEAAFRVRGRADKSADQYATHKVEVTWAKDARDWP